MKRLSARIGMGVLVLAATWSSAPQAATLVASFAEITQTADFIFVGTVQQCSGRYDALHSMVFTDVLFSDIEVVAARPGARQASAKEIVLTHAGGEAEGQFVRVSDQPDFVAGKRYLVCAVDDGTTYANPIVGGSQGLFQVVEDETSHERFVLAADGRPIMQLSVQRLGVGGRAVARIRGGLISLQAAAGDLGPEEIQPPAADAPPDRAEALPRAFADADLPITLDDFERFIRERSSSAAVDEPVLQQARRGATAGLVTPHGEAPNSKAPAGVAGDIDSLRTLLLPVPSASPGPAFGFAPAPPGSIDGDPVGACGYHRLPLVMEQVPTSWWSYNVNNNAMWVWNQSMDVFRYTPSDGTYGNNSHNEFCGWVADSELHRVYGFHWGTAIAMSLTWSSCECCQITQSDVMWNPAFNWTDDLRFAIDNPQVILLAPNAMHELGHAWGEQRGRFTETYQYDVLTVMSAYDPGLVEDGLGIHAVDAYLLRRMYSDQTEILRRRDIGVESYRASNGTIRATTDKSTYSPGERISMSGVTVENMSANALTRVRVRFFLSTDRVITTSDHQMGGYWYWDSFPGETYNTATYSTSIPADVRGGSYYIGIVVSIDGFGADDFVFNNVTSLTQRITIQNPVPTLASVEPARIERGGSATILVRGGGFVPGATAIDFGPGATTRAVKVETADRLWATVDASGSAALRVSDVVAYNPAPGGGTARLHQVFALGLTVYPGDTNADGLDDVRDLLPIGRYYGVQGAARPLASMSWSGQFLSGNWSPVEAAFADCDGNGKVEGVDVQALVLNWGRTRASTMAPSVDVASACATLLKQLDEQGNASPGAADIRRALLALQGNAAGSPAVFALHQNAPNPFGDRTTIAFQLPRSAARARLAVFDLQGRLVWEKVLQGVPAGPAAVDWDGRTKSGRQASQGLYFYVLETERERSTRRMLLVR